MSPDRFKHDDDTVQVPTSDPPQGEPPGQFDPPDPVELPPEPVDPPEPGVPPVPLDWLFGVLQAPVVIAAARATAVTSRIDVSRMRALGNCWMRDEVV